MCWANPQRGAAFLGAGVDGFGRPALERRCTKPSSPAKNAGGARSDQSIREDPSLSSNLDLRLARLPGATVGNRRFRSLSRARPAQMSNLFG